MKTPYVRTQKSSSWFGSFARHSAYATGHPLAFVLAVGVVLTWAVTGPLFGFSDTWQLVINTGTTIVTFLMVFVIQNATNRDAEAMHLKLDELIRAMPQANAELLDLEELEEDDLREMIAQYQARAREARAEHDVANKERGVIPARKVKRR